MDNNNHNVQITQIGICPICNQKLLEKKVNILGNVLSFRVPCACEIKKKKDELLKIEINKKRKVVEYYKNWSQIGIKNKNNSFNNYIVTEKNKSVVNAILYYCQNFNVFSKNGKSVFLSGNVGNGKTHLAIATMNYLTEQNYSVAFVKATRLITELDESKNYSSKNSITSIIKQLSSVDLLIIDDLGANVWNKQALDYFYKIIDTRYDNNKALFITSNISPDYLSQVIGARVFDRLSGCCKFLTNTEISYRRNEYQNKQ